MHYKIFGCKTNKYFTEKWLNSAKLQDKTGVFVASCVVTDRAKSKWVKYVIDSISGLKKWEKLYLTGCGVLKWWKLDKDFYEIYKELEKYKDKIELLEEKPEAPLSTMWRGAGGEALKSLYTRKYIVIQTGCDNHCTFCLTIQARWKNYSRGMDDIIAEIKLLEKQKTKEVVLTGINIWAYGTSNTRKTEESRLALLLEKILANTSIPRIRISSLGPEYIDDRLLKIFKNPRIYTHFHLSIQSGSDKILKLMGRNYDEIKLLEVLEKLNKLKREDWVLVSIGADIIIGFPGETEADFNKSLKLLKKYNITKLHAFPFSPHKYHYTVPASRLPDQVDDKTKNLRMNLINKIAEIVKDEFYKKNIWKTLHLLVEKKSWDSFSGWSENYIKLTEKNFKPKSKEVIKTGEIIEWKIFCKK